MVDLSAEKSRQSTFLNLPLEMRNLIYYELLVAAEPIRKPHKFLAKDSIMLDQQPPKLKIDGRILRVCWTTYEEALPILYGKNTFEFSKPRKLYDFSHGGLNVDRRFATTLVVLRGLAKVCA